MDEEALDDPVDTIDLGYRPRPQFRAFHARRQRWACIVAHRRAGKSVAAVMDLIDASLRCDKIDGRFSYVCADLYAGERRRSGNT